MIFHYEPILDVWYGRDVGLDHHVRDFVTMLKRGVEEPDDLDTTRDTLMVFTLARTYRLLFNRLVNGEQIWGANPIRLIDSWWRDSPTCTMGVYIGDESIAISLSDLKDALRQAGVHPLDDTRERRGVSVFPLNSGNARLWTNILRRSLEDLESALGFVRPSPRKRGPRKSQEFGTAHPPKDQATMYSALRAVWILYEFTRSKALAHLVPEVLAHEIRTRFGSRRSGDRKGKQGMRTLPALSQ